MGQGSFTTGGDEIPLARSACLVGVFRYDPDLTGDERYVFLPNVRVLEVDAPSEGPNPGSARFRYAFDAPDRDKNDPRRFEQVYPLDAQGDHVVLNDDRLVVRVYYDDGSYRILFDGFALVPQADLSRETESVTFEALGTPIREWDRPLGGAIVRNASDTSETNNDAGTDRPARFNPDGKANASPSPSNDDAQENSKDDPAKAAEQEGRKEADGDDDIYTWDSGGEDEDTGSTAADLYPVFMGPSADGLVRGHYCRIWTIGMAARYIVAVGNPEQEFIAHGDLKPIYDRALTALVPKDKTGTIDADDDSTYTTEAIPVEDLEVTGDPWPVALDKLISPHGFAFRFVLDFDDDGDPEWTMEGYRKASNKGRVKSVYLQRAGDAYDPSKTNVEALRLARDSSDVANQHQIDSGPTLVEASFILAPQNEFTAADGSEAAKETFKEGNADHYKDTNAEIFRVWVFDECGEGHMDMKASPPAFVDDIAPTNLDSVLKQKSVLPDGWLDVKDPRPAYAQRPRPGRNRLVTKDADKKPMRAQLWVSPSYKGPMPGVWDGSAEDWELVPDSAWELLPDRLGIKFNGNDPNDVSLGKAKDGAPDHFGGKLNLVDMMVDWLTAADPPDESATQHPRFRLTCTIEADQGLGVLAERRAASTVGFVVERRHDERSRFQKTVVSRKSHLALKNSKDKAVRDDTDKAQSHADASRWVHEDATFSGSVTLVGIRTSYDIGDKIDQIVGRDVSLRMNLLAEQKESPVYPRVVGIKWTFEDGQRTTLQIQDFRAEPVAKRRESSED